MALPLSQDFNHTTPESATIEVAQKMEGIESLTNMGRSVRSEIRLMLSHFAEIAAEQPDFTSLAERWKTLAGTKYAQNRGIALGPVSLSGTDVRVPVSYDGGREKIEFIFSPNNNGGYAPRMHVLESRPEIKKAIPSVPKSLSAKGGPGSFVAGTSSAPDSRLRSEARATILYEHDSNETRYSHKETVSLAPLGLNQFLSPFEIRALQAFLYQNYTRQPFLDERKTTKDMFRPFEGEISKVEAEAFFQMLYEIQESVRFKTGRAFDRQAILDRIKALYQKEVSGYDKRPLRMKKEDGTLVERKRAAAILRERKIWPEIFNDLLSAVMSRRSEQSLFIPVGLIELHGTRYAQVVPGTTMKLRFVKGGFPDKGISLLLGSERHEVVASIQKETIRFHYKQDASQDRIFDKRNEFGILNGHVGIGSAPEALTPRGKLITLPKADALAPRHAILAISEEKGIITVSVTDGYVTGGGYGPSGKMTLIEYPDTEKVELPHARSEARALPAEKAPLEQPAELKGLVFSKTNPDQIRGSSAARVTALAHGVAASNPDNLGNLKGYAQALLKGSPESVVEALSKKYPVLEASNNPGALIFVTAKIPDEKELTALRTLLLTQKNQFLRVLIPSGILSVQKTGDLNENVKKVFGPLEAQIGKRFKVMPFQNTRQLHDKAAQDIYNAMLEAKVPEIKSLPDLKDHYLLQWFDENAGNFSSAEISGARVMTSRIGAESRYSELMVWGAAHAMKISQGIEAAQLKQDVVALLQNGRRIEYLVSDSLRGLVSGFMKALQIQVRFEQAA